MGQLSFFGNNMKNRHIEKLRAQAKAYARSNKRTNGKQWDSKRKIYVYHLYSPEGTPEYKKYSYWDDVSFYHGSQMISVWWTHPRYHYSDELSHLAYEQVSEKYKKPVLSLDDAGEKIYKAVGKNKKRKRHVGTRINHQFNQQFYDEWKQVTNEYRNTSDMAVKCSYTIQQYGYCRGIDLCAPFEVRCEDDLVTLVEFVKKCLADPTHFKRTFGDYAYTKETWISEGHDVW